MTPRPFITAAALAVAAAVSGCTHAVVGTPMAAPVDVSATAPATPQHVTHQWKNVENELKLPLPQQGTEPLPGRAVDHTESDGEYHACTIGPAVWSAERNTAGVLTAGHCVNDDTGDNTQTLRTADGAEQPLGRLDPAIRYPGDTPGTAIDAGMIATSVAEAATRIGGVYPIAGVLTVEAAQRIINRTGGAGAPIICIDGAMSGIICGHGLSDTGADAESALLTPKDGGPLGQRGDSGAIVFVVENHTNRAALIGLVYGAIGGNGATRVTYLAPVLARLRVNALLDPDPAVIPFSVDDPDDFAPNVTAYKD